MVHPHYRLCICTGPVNPTLSRWRVPHTMCMHACMHTAPPTPPPLTLSPQVRWLDSARGSGVLVEWDAIGWDAMGTSHRTEEVSYEVQWRRAPTATAQAIAPASAAACTAEDEGAGEGQWATTAVASQVRGLRCVKSGLAPGAEYVFRVAPCGLRGLMNPYPTRTRISGSAHEPIEEDHPSPATCCPPPPTPHPHPVPLHLLRTCCATYVLCVRAWASFCMGTSVLEALLKSLGVHWVSN